VPIYHYHAISQMTIGTIINMDGIVNMRNPVVTMEDYRYLKKLIKINNIIICNPNNITICSLTVLQEDKR
jgi:hypothetical protein